LVLNERFVVHRLLIDGGVDRHRLDNAVKQQPRHNGVLVSIYVFYLQQNKLLLFILTG